MDKNKPHKDHNQREPGAPGHQDEAAGVNHSGAPREHGKKADAAEMRHVHEEIKKKDEEAVKLTEEVEKLRSEIDGLKDTMLRRQADFENYKKRNIKMFNDQKKLVIKDMALDMIMINDDLLRAIEASGNVKSGESIESAHNSFVDGVTMISRQIEEVLKKYGVVEIDSLNKEFDPNFNEAMEIEMNESVAHDTVTRVYQKGFCIDDQVVRAAKVKVAKPLKKETIPENDKAKGDDARTSEEGI